jgi:hypothetical protein
VVVLKRNFYKCHRYEAEARPCRIRPGLKMKKSQLDARGIQHKPYKNPNTPILSEGHLDGGGGASLCESNRRLSFPPICPPSVPNELPPGFYSPPDIFRSRFTAKTATEIGFGYRLEHFIGRLRVLSFNLSGKGFHHLFNS